MKFGIKLALTFGALSMGVACGPTEDPSKNNANPNNMQNNVNPNNMTTANNVTPNNMTTPNNVTPNNITPNNITPNNITPNNVDPGPRVANDMFYGQIDSQSDEHAGGAPSTDAFANDAGIAAAIGMIDVMEDMEQVVDIDITGATVTATSFGTGGNSNFWVQDSGGALQVRLDFMTPVPVTVKVGDAVSFKITSFNNFDGHPQVLTLENFAVDSSGNAVSYKVLTGQAPTAADYNTLVQIGGELSAAGTACGGSSMCFDLTHAGGTITYRSASEFLEGGECVTYFGPLSGFPGPNADSGNAPDWQLNVNNFSWSFTRFDP